jgi:hypothetical protein
MVNGALVAVCGMSRQNPNNNRNPSHGTSRDHICMSYVLLLSPSEDLMLKVSGRGLGVTCTRPPMSPSAAAAQQLWISWSAWGLWRRALRPASAWGWGEPWRVCGRGDAGAGAAIAPMHVCTTRGSAWKAMATHSFTDTRAVCRPSFLPARNQPIHLGPCCARFAVDPSSHWARPMFPIPGTGGQRTAAGIGVRQWPLQQAWRIWEW